MKRGATGARARRKNGATARDWRDKKTHPARSERGHVHVHDLVDPQTTGLIGLASRRTFANGQTVWNNFASAKLRPARADEASRRTTAPRLPRLRSTAPRGHPSHRAHPTRGKTRARCRPSPLPGPRSPRPRWRPADSPRAAPLARSPPGAPRARGPPLAPALPPGPCPPPGPIRGARARRAHLHRARRALAPARSRDDDPRASRDDDPSRSRASASGDSLGVRPSRRVRAPAPAGPTPGASSLSSRPSFA